MINDFFLDINALLLLMYTVPVAYVNKENNIYVGKYPCVIFILSNQSVTYGLCAPTVFNPIKMSGVVILSGTSIHLHEDSRNKHVFRKYLSFIYFKERYLN